MTAVPEEKEKKARSATGTDEDVVRELTKLLRSMLRSKRKLDKYIAEQYGYKIIRKSFAFVVKDPEGNDIDVEYETLFADALVTIGLYAAAVDMSNEQFEVFREDLLKDISEYAAWQSVTAAGISSRADPHKVHKFTSGGIGTAPDDDDDGDDDHVEGGMYQ